MLGLLAQSDPKQPTPLNPAGGALPVATASLERWRRGTDGPALPGRRKTVEGRPGQSIHVELVESST